LEAAGEEYEEVKPLAEELIDTLIDMLSLPTLRCRRHRIVRARLPMRYGRVELDAIRRLGRVRSSRVTGRRY